MFRTSPGGDCYEVLKFPDWTTRDRSEAVFCYEFLGREVNALITEVCAARIARRCDGGLVSCRPAWRRSRDYTNALHIASRKNRFGEFALLARRSTNHMG